MNAITAACQVIRGPTGENSIRYRIGQRLAAIQCNLAVDCLPGGKL